MLILFLSIFMNKSNIISPQSYLKLETLLSINYLENKSDSPSFTLHMNLQKKENKVIKIGLLYTNIFCIPLQLHH